MTLRNSILGTDKAPRSCGFGSSPSSASATPCAQDTWRKDVPGWAVTAVELRRSMELNTRALQAALEPQAGQAGLRMS